MASPIAPNTLTTSNRDARNAARISKRELQYRLASQDITGYITGNIEEYNVADTAQKRALRNYRSRMTKRGIARFEVLALDTDRDLIRSLARRLAQDGPDAVRLRAEIGRTISGEPPKKGGILEALRRSPLVGADLDIKRSQEASRKVDV